MQAGNIAQYRSLYVQRVNETLHFPTIDILLNSGNRVSNFSAYVLSNRSGTPCRSLLFLGQHLLHKTFLTLCRCRRRRRRRRSTSSHNIRGNLLCRKNPRQNETRRSIEKRPLKLARSRLVQHGSSTRVSKWQSWSNEIVDLIARPIN